MRKTFQYLLTLGLLLLAAPALMAGDNEPVAMADGLRASGKIYVVVAVLLTILIGLFLYLFRLERKIGKLESEQ